ncbi:MAG TPA: redox-regulated ATPase YchF [Candidatus Nanoarchaeia archaeon]|nr:redox-regulated ATPase YchF [Candidatus Nanoarchaeia archaeon]
MLIGLVGRPNAGKSTFFKAATLVDVLIANYPFATIKPNHGMAYIKIPDLAKDFGKVSNPREGYVKEGNRFVPFELMDVAGLVEGASQGKGLGNEFLNDLSAADAFIHVVDLSGETDGEGKPTENYDPSNDIRIIEKELDLWYLGILRKLWAGFARTVEMQKKKFEDAVAKQFSGLKVTEDDVRHVLLRSKLDGERPTLWTEQDLANFAQMLRKYTKPMILAANKVDRPNGKANFEKIKSEFEYPIVACFADGELSLRQADKAGLVNYVPGEKTFEIKQGLNEKQIEALKRIQETMNEFGSTGVQEVLNKVVLEILEYVAIYPAGAKLSDSKGNVLPDCYLMKKGSTALDFAYRLHSDIGRDFVKAMHIKTKQAVGKDYVLKHCDGLEILTK